MRPAGRSELQQAPYETGIGVAVSSRTYPVRGLSVKSIGKPYTENLHVRFDEGAALTPRLLYWFLILMHDLWLMYL